MRAGLTATPTDVWAGWRPRQRVAAAVGGVLVVATVVIVVLLLRGSLGAGDPQAVDFADRFIAVSERLDRELAAIGSRGQASEAPAELVDDVATAVMGTRQDVAALDPPPSLEADVRALLAAMDLEAGLARSVDAAPDEQARVVALRRLMDARVRTDNLRRSIVTQAQLLASE